MLSYVEHEKFYNLGILRLSRGGICTIRVAKTKALISFAVTAKLICAFVFAYADCWFSHGAAHIVKLGCLWVDLLFLFLLQNIHCGYSLELP